MPAFTERFPGAYEYVVVATGVNNEIAGKWITDRIQKSQAILRQQGQSVLDESRYKVWTEVYRDLAKSAGLNAKDFMPSHVALAKRVLAGKDLPHINPVVNFYNLYSITYGIPIGGENLEALYGDETLGISEGKEQFLEIGSDMIDVLGDGEVIWRDAQSVTCRMWAWRQSDRTKLTKKTQDIYFVFDGLTKIDDVDLFKVVSTFSRELEEKFGAKTEIFKLDKDNPEFEVSYKTKSIPPDFWGEHVVVGKLLEVKPHPKTDTLVVTLVDIGEKENVTIVCGNTALKQGQVVTVIKPGGKRYDQNRELDDVYKVSVKGVESNGILGTPLELGIGESYYDEWILPVDTEKYVGKALKDIIAQLQIPLFVSKKKIKSKDTAGFMKRRAPFLGLTDDNQVLSRVRNEIQKSFKGTDYEGISTLKLMNSEVGDIALVDAMKFSGKLKKSPKIIAEEIVNIMKKGAGVSRYDLIEAHPSGFVNLTFSTETLVTELKKAMSECENYGSSSAGNNRTILIESPAINPNAAAHIGHLLNLFIGRALARLFEKVGFVSEIDNLINDRGIKICMAMWGVQHLATASTPERAGMKPDQYVGLYYVQAKQKYEEDARVKAEIQQMLRDWEAGKPEVMELWKRVVGWAYEGHKATFDRLHEEEGFLWLESEIYKGGKKVIGEYIGRGVIEKLPDGAVIGRLEQKYGIPDVILMRADGTSLYETQDIHLTMLKVEKFKPWRAIWVVGSEQLAHFQKLFALFDALGILPVDNLYHMAYGMIVDKNGVKIGKNAADATADMILDQMRDVAKKVMSERKVQHEGSDIERIAEAVGQGALRFAFLSKDPFKGTVYDPESALSFTGRSGPYVMYAYTRAKNVLRKALGDESDTYGFADNLNNMSDSISIASEERSLALALLTYPEMLLSAANSYAPDAVAEYLYTTARLFSNMYEKYTISGAEGDQRLFRLMLTRLTAHVLKDGLEILGIQALEQM